MTGTYSIKGVPTANLPSVVAGFRSEGATVTTIPQDDGNWTVIAVYPETVASPETRGAEKHT
ncbi:hypothetical protein EBB_19250 [Methylomonas sp. EbB]|uniref:Uncharacterized protein n=1 Tax=Methylomonas fluvii TaxID=1854564 RepID=A0ABR9DIG8_9GAMM|nr:hypothetical protein [Methylomonas fluvii]